MSDEQQEDQVYSSIKEYCETYNIPLDNLLDILEDQKVLPMIRGKATEYIGAAVLKQTLNKQDWSVAKLNLNPQQGTLDEDISITHRKTGERLKAETKNAVRGGFSLGNRNTEAPHFKVKCHKSRSNLKHRHNDRYLAEEFDLLLCNVSNSIYKPKSLDRAMVLIENTEAVEWLKKYYGVSTDQDLWRKAYDDWRCCLPSTIKQKDGTLPRTPCVLLENDPNWFGLDELADRLRSIIPS